MGVVRRIIYRMRAIQIWYDSDVENTVVPVEHSGLRPYRFEPRRVEQNEQQVSSKTI